MGATVEGLDDYTEYGGTLLETVIAEMKQNSHEAEYTALRAYGAQIVQALVP